MLRAVEAGLSVQDFELLTVGMVFDLLITSRNEQQTGDQSGVRGATQADFDRF